MKTLKGKGKLTLYSFGGFGINLLNLMMGSYLCSAVIATGFGEDAIGNQTFVGIDLVIAGVWAAFVLVAKIIDGVIDIPLASFTDRLKCRFGRRRPSILLGLIGVIASYAIFATIIPDASGASIGNTIFYGVILCLFYISYTLTMVTYYATFTEIVDNEGDRQYISNVKSVADVVYFIVGYVLVAMMLKGLNIKWVALIVLPIALTMLIPLFLIKEGSTKEGGSGEVKTVNLFKSLGYTFQSKDFIVWMCVYAMMNFGLQLFLGGINEYFSVAGMSMMIVMACTFAPVPFALILYNHIVKKKGFGFAFRYILIAYAVSMIAMFFVGWFASGTLKTILAIVCGLGCSLSVGAFFSVAYSIPSHLAVVDQKRTGIDHSAMYFAVQGLFSGIATGLATGVVLTLLKTTDTVIWITLISGGGCLVAFLMTFFLPKSVNTIGMVNLPSRQEAVETKQDAGSGDQQ